MNSQFAVVMFGLYAIPYKNTLIVYGFLYMISKQCKLWNMASSCITLTLATLCRLAALKGTLPSVNTPSTATNQTSALIQTQKTVVVSGAQELILPGMDWNQTDRTVVSSTHRTAGRSSVVPGWSQVEVLGRQGGRRFPVKWPKAHQVPLYAEKFWRTVGRCTRMHLLLQDWGHHHILDEAASQRQIHAGNVR